MRHFKKSLMGVFVSMIITAPMASQAAETTTINIQGKVIAAACTVDNSGVYAVTMPDVTAAELVTAGSAPDSGKKDFDVTLSECPQGTTSVTATFVGTAAVGASTKYANTTGAGYAQNVAVQLQNRTGAVSDKGDSSTMKVDVDGSRNVTFDLSARPYSLGNTTVGNISTVVLMNLEYN